MTTISSVRALISHNLDPVANSDSVAQDERHTRALKSRGSSSRGHGHHHSHNGNNVNGHGTNAGGSVNGTANSSVPKPPPKPSQKVDKEGWPLNDLNQRVDRSGHAIDKEGRRINERNQLINDKNQTINNNGQWINDQGQTLNTLGKPVDGKNRLIDSQNRLINRDGRLIDEHKGLIDKDGKRVNEEGYLVDNIGRPLDKNGQVAKSKDAAVLGNNEPHPQLNGMTNSLKNKPTVGPGAAPAAPAAPSLEESVKKASKTSELVGKGWIPSAPELSKTFILAMVSGFGESLAALPVNAASTATTESIQAAYLPKPLDTSTTAPTPPTSGGTVAPESEADKARREKQAKQNGAINNLQVSVFETQSALVKLASGQPELDLAPGAAWPEDPIARLDKLEELLDHMEPQTQELSKRHKVYYEVPELPESSPASGAEGVDARIKILEKRLNSISALRHSVEASIAKFVDDFAGVRNLRT